MTMATLRQPTIADLVRERDRALSTINRAYRRLARGSSGHLTRAVLVRARARYDAALAALAATTRPPPPARPTRVSWHGMRR